MKNLLSESLSKKKLAIISASFIVFAAAFGFVIFEMTKKSVVLTLDGREEIIKTHADTINEIFDEMDITLRSEDYVFPSVNTKVENDLEVVWNPANEIELVNGSETKSVWSAAETVGEFLQEQNIEITEHDLVEPKQDEKITGNTAIQIEKAFSLTLSNGGEEKKVWSTSTTVADFLSQQGIELKELDRVEPNLEETVKVDDVIKVIRVEKVTDVVEEPINYAVVTKKDNSLNRGSEKVVTPGQEGLVSKQFEIIKENGKEISRKLISEKTLKEKQDKVVAVGTKVAAETKVVSRGSAPAGGKEIYVSSTAYTASCNGCSGFTATGINLKANPNVKVIAVDPSVIPLGTKVYVEGYGYAVAADTGSAVKGNKIDVFFANKSDAYRWGRKSVKIKILN
ncbi:G5 and 3D domain-containing protein [Cytobacillus gottheilii]|uniref:G5 and 3D domain-containing protein n=1 Tax=Cytobacillus gottheilii TaxID=859144 RepID=UPI0009BB6C82|nr:G5 and 3D domain-containing protein [Cytobacillus gottheilii]